MKKVSVFLVIEIYNLQKLGKGGFLGDFTLLHMNSLFRNYDASSDRLIFHEITFEKYYS